MKMLIVGIVLILTIAIPVTAAGISIPKVPESAESYMPESNETFAQGLWHIVKTAIAAIQPELTEAAGICLSVVAITMLLSILNNINADSALPIRITGAVVLGILLLEPVNTMIHLGSKTINQLSDYCKLLLPVMTSALAAQGGTTASAALYAGTAFFNALLSSIISRLIVPALYVYLCFCVINSALDQELLKKIRDTIKWAMTWMMKWTLYIFTGYISITGVISGSVDASVLKATKLSISGTVPVVGSVLADATETILLSARIFKNTAGIYGIFAVLSICIGPFIRIGIPYLLLKLTAGITHIFGHKPTACLVEDFAAGMGFALAMTGTVCVLLLISLVCFMKGLD